MVLTYDAIWGFREEILELRGKFKEHVWLAHLSQPWGIPLHKYEGKITIEGHKINFSGKDKDTQQPSGFPIPREKLFDVYLGWDGVIRRWKDTRALIKPIRITFKTNGESKTLYLYVKEEGAAVYGEENKRLYTELLCSGA